MKIGIVTFHDAKNYGAALQAYALCKYINNNLQNVDAEIVDYKCKYLDAFYDPSLAFGNSIKGRIKRFLAKTTLTQRNRVFAEFVKHNIPLSTRYDENNINSAQNYDAYIAGSDMLWHWHTDSNGEHFDNTYFLDFVKGNSKKNSYAASFGTESIDSKYEEHYKSMLKDFNNISVREESGIGFIEKFTGKKPLCHVDPTLLFTMQEWRKIEKKPQKDSYILLYEVGSISERMLSYAKKLANEKSKELIILLSEYDPIKSKGIFGYSPQEFLGWFDNADYVITNSFHGTVFSILYHKQFLVEINSWIKNNRSSELMEKLNLSDRTLDLGTDIDFTIDWNMVDAKLNVLRDDTEKYLNKIVCGE